MRAVLFKIFVIVFHMSAGLCFGISNKDIVNKADTLFMKTQYDLALKNYQEVFESSKTYSTNMLLKMAFISEWKEEPAKQLFYLCTLYRHHPHSKILKKIVQVADYYNLGGYSYSELEYFISLYKQYYNYILLILILISLLFIGYLYYRKKRGISIGYRPLLFLLFLAVFYFVSNYSLIPPRGIVNKNACLLMTEASAASKVETVIGLGHRITVLAKKDIWCLVSWESKRLYIKESDLYIIPESQPYFF
jgi:hypothetical protein